MIVEVSGGESVNRGARLMLRTVAEMLRRSEPQVSVGADVLLCRGYPGSGCGIAPLFPRLVPFRRPYWMFSRFCGPDRAACGLVPRALCERKGFVRRSAVSALLDVSGYAFGDSHPLAAIPAVRQCGSPIPSQRIPGRAASADAGNRSGRFG